MKSTIDAKPLTRAPGGELTFTLPYEAPLDWKALLRFVAARATPGAESVQEGVYARTVRMGASRGWLSVSPVPGYATLGVVVSASLASAQGSLVAPLRALFDLDARPDVIAGHFGADPRLSAMVAKRPGLRVPGAFDPFEVAIRAILGQQVSVPGATTLTGRFASTFGEPLASPDRALRLLFPTPERIARATVEELASIGLPKARARTLGTLARAVVDGGLRLVSEVDPTRTMESLLALPGIGQWTANYVAMRALGAHDAFPAGDLVLRRILGVATEREAVALAEPWRPWRSYAAMHLWTSLAGDEP